MDLLDIRKVDAGLGASLERLAACHRAWMAAGRPSAPLLVDGSPLEDLCLSFVLPGALPPPSSVQHQCSHAGASA
jgi:E3 ubiquitin-protein ligase TRIP12